MTKHLFPGRTDFNGFLLLGMGIIAASMTKRCLPFRDESSTWTVSRPRNAG